MKILICDDEYLIAENLKFNCTDLGYEVVGVAHTKLNALELLESEKPDIVLLDINLEGNMEGLEIANVINQTLKIPFLFITAYSDSNTLLKASKLLPSAFIVKPIDDLNLKINLELALLKQKNIQYTTNTNNNKNLITNPKDITQVDFSTCTYINANQNYIYIYFEDNSKYIFRFMISELDKIVEKNFLRVHKSYIVNMKYVSTVLATKLYVLGTWVPIGRSYKLNIKSYLDLK